MSSITEIITKLSSAKRELFINELKNRSILEPIAIVGIGCRFPGNCNSPSSFWEMLRNSQDAICEVPKDRWDIEDFYDPDPLAPGKMNTRWGGFLKGVDLFDADFFSISPREAMHMDPQQRLLLEVAWEALDDAGLVVNKLAKTQTGVFLGLSLSDYGHLQWQNVDSVDVHVNTGSCLSIAAGRLSYSFDFRGPSFVVDTACSSSLVAINLACQSLWRGETTLALAGGASLMLLPSVTVGFTKLGAMSADGYCKTFDSRANGYVRGEGVGVVVLKTLSKALADGDQIYSVIRSCAVNQDGKSNGLTAPNLNSQENVLSQAYQQANISPNQIQYIEAHGTGTSLGDPIEVQALANVLSFGRSNENYCSIGSVKTNIGHLEAAAGIAGLIKVALSLKNKQIPPSLHFEKPNPLIDFDTLPIKVQTNLGPWPDETERLYAGISSFGFSGTNAHIVLEEWTNNNQNQEKDQTNIKQEHILLITGKTEKAVKEQVIKYIDYLKTSKENLVDICFSSIVRRSHHNVKLTVIGKNKTEIIQALEEYQKEGVSKRIYIENNKIHKEEKIVFVCSGQGGQWWGMCRSYFNNDVVFRNTILKCDAILTEYTKFSLVDIFKLTEDVGKEKIKETSIAQPMIFAIEVALAEVYKSYGIEPSAIVGHSVGEIAAAYIAGVLTLKDAIKVVVYRSKLMEETKGKGKTIVIDINSSKIFKLLEKYPRLSIAAINSKSTTLVSGNIKDLEELIKDLEELTINSKYLQVDYPFHSKEMEQISKELEEILSMIEVNESKICLVSTVYGEVISGREMNRKYWGANLRKPVLFEQAIKKLAEFEIFIELGPHPTLLSHIATTIETDGKAKTFIASSNREYEDMFMLSCSLAKLLSKSYPIDWKRFYPSSIYTPLPSYSWQRQSFWLDNNEQKNTNKEFFSNQVVMSTNSDIHIFESIIDLKNDSYLKDHQVMGKYVLPSTFYFSLVFAALRENFTEHKYSLVDVEIKRPLFLQEDENQKLQLLISFDDLKTGTFQIASSQRKDSQWTIHCNGKLEKIELSTTFDSKIIQKTKENSTRIDTKSDYYNWANTYGMQFGAAFQPIERIFYTSGQLLAELIAPSLATNEVIKYKNKINPGFLDGCFQSVSAFAKDNLLLEKSSYIPSKIESFKLYQNLPARVWSYSVITNDLINSNNKIVADVYLIDERNNLVGELSGVTLQKVTSDKTLSLKHYQIEWRKNTNKSSNKPIKNCLIFASNHPIANSLQELLARQNADVTLVFASDEYKKLDNRTYQINPNSLAEFQKLFSSLELENIDSIVYFWALDAITEGSLPKAKSLICAGSLNLIKTLTETVLNSKIYLITSFSQNVGYGVENPLQAMLWGFGRSVIAEYPSLQCLMIDLQKQEDARFLFSEIASADNEKQVVLFENQRYVARFVEKDISKQQEKIVFNKQSSFRLEIGDPGILDSLKLRIVRRKKPAYGEVEIQIYAAGLNFIDVMKAMGIYPGLPPGIIALGSECSGIISSIGEGVNNFKVGDEVLALAPFSFGSQTIVSQHLVVKKPKNISFEQAATIPIAFLTAYYGLHTLGNITRNDKVLIHSATGGVGLAAIQIAQLVGAEIFATAGSEEKRAYLKALGIKHVMDSRSLDFADQILQITDGEGIDIVLNSLAGEAITKNFAILAPYGRFIEIGKKDIYQNTQIGLSAFQKSLSYSAIDFARMFKDRAELCGKLLKIIVKEFELGNLKPIELTTYTISNVVASFRHMAQAKHIGKIAISLENDNLNLYPSSEISFDSNATYLITGGLGVLGLTFAEYLAKKGAGEIILIGRNAKSELIEEKLNNISKVCKIEVIEMDISDQEQVIRLLDKRDIKGIIHAAGVLQDGTLQNLDWNKFSKVLPSKVDGTWYLHNYFKDSLEFFVMFSSASSVLGSSGQSNYAAANSFLDSLAHYRHQKSLKAVSINWGPWKNLGMAASQDTNFSSKGILGINLEDGLKSFEQILKSDVSQITSMTLDFDLWQQYNPVLAQSSLFSEMATIKQESSLKEKLLDIESPVQRRVFLENHIKELTSKVLKLTVNQIDSEVPLLNLGLDSLMGTELKNLLEASLKTALSSTLIWNYPTIFSLTSHLAEKIGISVDQKKDEKSFENIPVSNKQEQVIEKITALSEEEAESLLLEKLAKFEKVSDYNE